MADPGKFDPDIFLPRASSLVPKHEYIRTGATYQKITMDRPGSLRALTPATAGTIYVHPVDAPSSDAQAIPYPDGVANLPGVGEWWVRHSGAGTETFQVVYDGPPGSTAAPGSGTAPAPVANRGAFATAQKNVAAAGTGENLAALAVPDGCMLVIKAKQGNTGSIWVGTTKANSENHAVAYELVNGEPLKLSVNNANLVWIDADVNGEGVNIIVEQ